MRSDAARCTLYLLLMAGSAQPMWVSCVYAEKLLVASNSSVATSNQQPEVIETLI
jgi:hypothetical protein